MPSGGVVGYFGYEYQFFATTLLMLNAHAAKDFPFKLSIETLSGEDAELERRKVKLLSAEQVVDDKTVLQVQVKTKQKSQHWQPSDIRDLLLKKDENDANDGTVLDKLYSSQNSSFLFITDGSVSTTLAGLLSETLDSAKHIFGDGKISEIRKAIINSGKDEKHKKILSRKLTRKVLSRIFIVANLSFEDIQRQIREILLWNYGIPFHQVYKKTDALAEIVRGCARRKNNKSVVESSDVTEIISVAGVELPSREVEAIYQKTKEYDSAEDLLRENHIVLISGEPGYGKTTLAYKLANELVKQHFLFEELSGEDSYLNVLRACRTGENIIFLLDDAFGHDDYGDNLGIALGNNFEQIVQQLQEAKGRVKVIITSRSNVVALVRAKTKLNAAALDSCLITIAFSSEDLYLKVLETHLFYFGGNPKFAVKIAAISPLSTLFENLYHVRNFSRQFIQIIEGWETRLISLVEETKPSLYGKWIEKQAPEVQLVLISLFLVLEVNQFAKETEVGNLFNVLFSCASPPPITGFYHPYNGALRDLYEQDRILSRRENVLDFIHPTLKDATSRHFNSIIENKKFLSSVIDTLIKLDSPLPQSLAVYLTIYCLEGREQFEMLSLASKSKYIQVIDTIIRFGRLLLESGNNDLKQLTERIFEAKFHPSECNIDENGYLVRKVYEDKMEMFIHTASEMAEVFEWEIGFFPEKEPDLAAKFQEVLQEQSLALLNPLERHKFVDWLFRLFIDNQIAQKEFDFYLNYISADPISFVRERVAEHLGRLPDISTINSLIESLCFDSSPYVRIAMLENVLLRCWANQEKETKKLWLDLVVGMLSDTVVRHKCMRGLVDRSGSLYYYHETHTVEQKREWFEAIALKLLTYDFHADDFERFLEAFDIHYSSFEKEYRLKLLTSLYNFIENNLYRSTSILYVVNQVLFESKPSEEELSIILKLINLVPSVAKAEFCFRFALQFDQLPDERFREFVHRPFYIESPDELIFERTAAVLGFLANFSDAKTINKLPSPVGEMADGYLQAISKYIENQNDEFKLITIFQAFGHENSYYVSANYYSLYAHPLVKKLLREFVLEKPQDPNTKIIAMLLLNSFYYRTEALYGQRAEWLEFVELMFSSKDIDLLKSICDILFEGNVAASVHNVEDWLFLLTRLLTHPISEVHLYAVSLYDRYFLDVWEDLSGFLHKGNKNRNKYLDDVWLNDIFFQTLLENSPSFKEYLDIMHYSEPTAHPWRKKALKYRQISLGKKCVKTARYGG
jgi:DNA polymerase III delta prime subunit